LPSKEIADCVAFWAAVATIIALPCGVAAAWYAAGQLSLARKAGSGASLIALSEAFRDCWRAFLASDDERSKQLAFGDLANALEIACAIFGDGIFFGRSKDLLEHYLSSIFQLIEGNVDARGRLLVLLQTPRTFENIVDFMAKHRVKARGAHTP
jgi:hypothetical protein